MNTPIADFVRGYTEKNMSRLHMPGHKGNSFLGCEAFDITEIAGADSLYEADGIIAESEANAASLFGTGRTVYSTEGSSQCIRAMLYLAIMNRKTGTKPVIVAARNVHKAFVYAAALLDFEIVWLWPEGNVHSICSSQVSPESLEKTLESLSESPAAVYITSPDYLGGQLDISAFAEICHKYGTILAVDNAHGAYLHFTEPSMHPIDLGADICSDSAHKTLPVLTGGAYLQISKNAPENFRRYAKSAMALFGSTSPSYLTMISLDLCNQYLSDGYRERLKKTSDRIQKLRDRLLENGWQVEITEPLKVAVCMPEGVSGAEMAQVLRNCGIECEYADPEYLVFMFTPENPEEDYQKLEKGLGINQKKYVEKDGIVLMKCEQKMSVRNALFTEHEEVKIEDAEGRICASPTVSCPPAIPIAVSGEVIDKKTVELFRYYGTRTVYVIKE
ncbi:MAG: aminotransferase class V-fold PLP-dependent enzyme [Schaedlerella sp.]|nr:aminotransferase class V-fold PLP-dependent enzyme [Schaedlerella sp.]